MTGSSTIDELADVGKCVEGTHIAAWRSLLRLPTALGEVRRGIFAALIAQHRPRPWLVFTAIW